MAREMKDSGVDWIGYIPNSWCIARYKNFAYNRMGETILSEDTSDNGVPIYSATQDGKIFGYMQNPKLLLSKGDIVIPARGNSIGCATIICDEIATCTQTTICSKVHDIEAKFLYYCSWGLKDYWYKYDGAAIPQVTVKQVNENVLCVPSKAEQQSIANFLDKKCSEIDDLISLQEKMVDELKAYKQSVIIEAVTKGLNPNVELKDSGVDWIGNIPKHWNTQRLRTLGWTQNGISKSGDYFGEDYPYPFVSYPDAYKNYEVPYPKGRANSSDDDRRTYSLLEGDVLFTRTSETIEEIGFASTCMTTIPNAVYSGFLIRFRPTSDKLYKGFSKYYFRSQIHRGYFVKQMNIVTRASLSQDLLKSLTVLLPPTEEQKEIADYLDTKCSEIDALISIKQKKIDQLKEYKKSLIYEYVTGKKEVV